MTSSESSRLAVGPMRRGFRGEMRVGDTFYLTNCRAGKALLCTHHFTRTSIHDTNKAHSTSASACTSRLRKGRTLASLAQEMNLRPEAVYSYLTSRRGHSEYLRPDHFELEARALGRIQARRRRHSSELKLGVGTIHLGNHEGHPYGQSMIQMLGEASLASTVENYSASQNVSKPLEDISEDLESLERLATVYCGPLPKKPNRTRRAAD